MLVRSGGRVPADGDDRRRRGRARRVDGHRRVPPGAQGAGDRVVAGTVSTDSAIRVRVDAVGDDTALAGIQRLVAEAQASRSRAQALADRAAALLFYVAAAAGVVTFVVWTALGDADTAVVRTVTVLVIACPHALGLAIPLVDLRSRPAIAARAGILVKDRLALERMRTIDAVLFDKTGTLTKGEHAVTGVAGAGGIDEAERAAPRRRGRGRHRAPAGPGHRRAAATADGAVPAGHRASGRSPAGASRRPSTARRYAVGGPALLRERRLDEPGRARRRAPSSGASAGRAVLLRRPRRTASSARSRSRTRSGPSPPRPSTSCTASGVRVVMITGDARQVADAVGRRPRHRRGLRRGPARGQGRQGRRAPGPRASRSPWSATASTTPRRSPEPTSASPSAPAPTSPSSRPASCSPRSDPRSVLGVIRLSQASYRKMVQNLAWGAGYNIVAIPLAAGVLAWAGHHPRRRRSAPS